MKILLAIDGSACSDAAVAEVARRPWPADSRLRVISAFAPCPARRPAAKSISVPFEKLGFGRPGGRRVSAKRAARRAVGSSASSVPTSADAGEKLDGFPRPPPRLWGDGEKIAKGD